MMAEECVYASVQCCNLNAFVRLLLLSVTLFLGALRCAGPLNRWQIMSALLPSHLMAAYNNERTLPPRHCQRRRRSETLTSAVTGAQGTLSTNEEAGNAKLGYNWLLERPLWPIRGRGMRGMDDIRCWHVTCTRAGGRRGYKGARKDEAHSQAFRSSPSLIHTHPHMLRLFVGLLSISMGRY